MEKSANGNMMLTDANSNANIKNYSEAQSKTIERSVASGKTDGETAFAVYNQ